MMRCCCPGGSLSPVLLCQVSFVSSTGLNLIGKLISGHFPKLQKSSQVQTIWPQVQTIWPQGLLFCPLPHHHRPRRLAGLSMLCLGFLNHRSWQGITNWYLSRPSRSHVSQAQGVAVAASCRSQSTHVT